MSWGVAYVPTMQLKKLATMSVDVLLGRNCPNFKQVVYKAEEIHPIRAEQTRQQTKKAIAEEIQCQIDIECSDVNPTPLSDLLGEDW